MVAVRSGGGKYFASVAPCLPVTTPVVSNATPTLYFVVVAIADQPEIDGSAARITLRGPHSVSEITYESGQWSSKERSTTADDELFARLVDELQAHPLLVEGAPFTLLEIVRHAGLRWFSGVAGEREVTFVEGRARWKSDAEVSRRN